MDNRLFAEGYPPHSKHIEWDESPEVSQLLQGPRYWVSFFDDQLSLYLRSKNLTKTADVEDELQYEYNWSSRYLDKIKTKMAYLALNNPLRLQQLNELNFLTMSEPLTALWSNVLTQKNYYFGPQYLTDTQTLLAMEAAKLVIDRRWAISTYGEKSPLVAGTDGQLSEIDTLLIMLEMMKNEVIATGKTTMVALPAPPRFEANSIRSRNADLLLFDTEYDQVRGVQVKTYTANDLPETTSYDRSLVTIIDGSTDLGNTSGSYRSDQQGKLHFVMKSLPGLISMDHLQSISTNDIPHGDDAAYGEKLVDAKSIAQELSGDRKSFIQQATAHVSAKLLTDLYSRRKRAS